MDYFKPRKYNNDFQTILGIMSITDSTKYHLGIKAAINNEMNSDGIEWYIFKLYDDPDKYFSPDNKAILTSNDCDLPALLRFLILENAIKTDIELDEIDKLYKDMIDRGYKEYPEITEYITRRKERMDKLKDEIQEEIELIEYTYNNTITATTERIITNTSAALLFVVAMVELIWALIRGNVIENYLYSLQCFVTFLLYLYLNKGIKLERKLRYKKEAEAIIYKKAFSEEWAKNVSNKKEQVRKEE